MSNLKIKKKTKVEDTSVEEVVSDLELEAPAEVSVADLTSNIQAAAPEPVVNAPAPLIAPSTPHDMVRVTFLKELQPPPRVGKYDMRQIHKLELVRLNETHAVPRWVAEVLKDAGVALMHD